MHQGFRKWLKFSIFIVLRQGFIAERKLMLDEVGQRRVRRVFVRSFDGHMAFIARQNIGTNQ